MQHKFQFYSTLLLFCLCWWLSIYSIIWAVQVVMTDAKHSLFTFLASLQSYSSHPVSGQPASQPASFLFFWSSLPNVTHWHCSILGTYSISSRMYVCVYPNKCLNELVPIHQILFPCIRRCLSVSVFCHGRMSSHPLIVLMVRMCLCVCVVHSENKCLCLHINRNNNWLNKCRHY